MKNTPFTVKHLARLIPAASMVLSGAAIAQQDTNQEQLGLEEIVVTAQFIEQNVQDTPIAITAISGKTLEARGQQSVQDIAAQAPNVTLTAAGSFAGPSLIGFIRGVGQTDFNPALEPGVGLYVDDVYYSTLTGSVLDLLDLERVEVLRGPQGTLAGKNSIGGAIKLYSKKPSEENDGYVEVAYGTYDEVSTRAGTNLTLVPETLYARIAGVSRTREGHISVQDFGCANPAAAAELGLSSQIKGSGCETDTQGGISYTALKGTVRWIPSDDLEMTFSADVLNDKSETPANTIFATGPTVAPVFLGNQIWPVIQSTADSLPPFLQALINPDLGNQFIPDDPYVTYSTYTDPNTGSTITPEQTLDATGYSLNVDWQLSDDIQLQSITGYRKYDSSFGTDPDGTPAQVQQLYQVLHHNQLSQEFRLNGKAGDVDYTVGAFYFDADTEMEARVTLGYVGFDFIHGPDPVDSTTWAVFGQSIWHLNDNLALTLGIRYTDDQKDYEYARHNADLSTIEPCLGPPGTPGNPPNCLISSLDGTTSSFEDERTDYRVALSYNINDNVMAYAQWSTGFKGGGVNPRPFYNVQAVTFQPEELEAYEIGFKADLLENKLRVNGALFQNDYSDVLLTFNECTELFGPIFGNPCLTPQNGGDSDVKGAELEFDFLPIDGLTIDGSISYLDFEFTSIEAATGLSDDVVTPYTPEMTWSLGIQYEWKTSAGTFIPRLDASYQDDIYASTENTENQLIDDYTLVNANITWISDNEDWQVSLIGRNLSDKFYFTSKTDAVVGGGGTAYGAPGLPRTYTLKVKRLF